MRAQSTASPGNGKVFGIPLGDFGLFSSLLLSLALGFIAFFASAFFAIFGILIYNGIGHHSVNFADSYKFIALPVGLTILVLSLLLFGTLWIRRKTSGR